MTNEEREAIELAKEFTKMDFSNPMGWTGYYDTELKELQNSIATVLNMLKEKNKEIEKKDKRIQELEEENAEIKNTKMNEYLHKNLWLAKYLNELYIPKQTVIDKIDELGISDEDINIKYVLKELLEEGGKK